MPHHYSLPLRRLRVFLPVKRTLTLKPQAIKHCGLEKLHSNKRRKHSATCPRFAPGPGAWPECCYESADKCLPYFRVVIKIVSSSHPPLNPTPSQRASLNLLRLLIAIFPAQFSSSQVPPPLHPNPHPRR